MGNLVLVVLLVRGVGDDIDLGGGLATVSQLTSLKSFYSSDYFFLNLLLKQLNLFTKEIAHLGFHLTEISHCLVLFGVVETLHSANFITHI